MALHAARASRLAWRSGASSFVPFSVSDQTRPRQALRCHAAAASSTSSSSVPSPAPALSAPSAPAGARPLTATYRVRDLRAHVDYYSTHFGMRVLRGDAASGAAVMGFGSGSFAVELLQHADAPGGGRGGALDLGSGFGHFGLAAKDVYALCDTIKAQGGKVTREAGPVKGGTTVIAFVEDPSGYKWELIQRADPGPEPLCQVMLRVSDLRRSMAWYQAALGMGAVRARDTPEYKYTLAFMAYGPEERSAVVELTYNYGVGTYTAGNAYQGTTLALPQLAPGPTAAAAAERIRQAAVEAGGSVVSAAPLVVADPDGWRFTLVAPPPPPPPPAAA